MPIILEEQPVENPETLIEKRPADDFYRMTSQLDAQRDRERALDGVKRIVGIHSGKGGVGKTFLTCNVAYALAEFHGLSVGILDGDIDCPNVPKFLSLERPMYTRDKRFQPVLHNGVKIVSMGFVKEDEAEPILLRGPAKHRIALDLLTNTDWGALDILLVDLPPGTSDVPMSMLEFGEVDGMLFVTTPQKEALTDTRKSIGMARQFAVHCIGIVENMGDSVFGKGKALAVAEETGIPYLGSIPLSEQVFEANERGEIAFLDKGMEPVVLPILDAVMGKE